MPSARNRPRGQLWSADREEVKVPEIEGKKLVTAVLSGGAPSNQHKDSAFLQKIQKASIYCRWLSVLQAAAKLPATALGCGSWVLAMDQHIWIVGT